MPLPKTATFLMVRLDIEKIVSYATIRGEGKEDRLNDEG